MKKIQLLAFTGLLLTGLASADSKRANLKVVDAIVQEYTSSSTGQYNSSRSSQDVVGAFVWEYSHKGIIGDFLNLNFGDVYSEDEKKAIKCATSSLIILTADKETKSGIALSLDEQQAYSVIKQYLTVNCL